MNTTEQLPAEYGAPYEGGYFAGVVRIGDTTCAIAAAPKAQGETTGHWIDGYKAVPGARSCCDSMANTLAMAEAGSQLAQWALALDINGHKDWCLPARDVLELCYRNLKPTPWENSCTFRDGDNASSVPVGYPYTEASPVQTSAPAFQQGGAEAFEADYYLSSTQCSADYAYLQGFYDGGQYGSGKSFKAKARAVRLIPLNV